MTTSNSRHIIREMFECLTAAFNILIRDPLLAVLVLEANDTVGGRIKPIPMEGSSKEVIQDCGGHFISRRQDHLMCLLNRLGIDVVDYDFTTGQTLTETSPNDFIKSKGALLVLGTDIDKDELTCFYRKLEQLCQQISMENPMGSIESEYLDSISMDKFIDEHLVSIQTRQHFKNMVRTICGSEPDSISPLFYLAFCNSTGGVLAPYLRQLNGARSSYIKDGAHNLVNKLVTEVGEQRILIDAPVQQISRSEYDVIVTTAKAKFKCRCAILAIPPTQLADMNFAPPLNTGKLDVLQRMKGKKWMKFLATYKEPFWQKKSLSGDVFVNSEVSECPAVMALNISTEDCTALMGLVDVERLHDAKNFDVEVLQQLARYFGSEALEPLDYVERHWPESPIEAPISSNPKLETMQFFHEIRRPIGRLYFAGSETATYWYGHIGGAVQAGLRAALEVLYEIRPQVLCYNDFTELKPKREILSYYEQVSEAPDHERIGWMTKAAAGAVATAGAYFGTGTISTAYHSIFGGENDSNPN